MGPCRPKVPDSSKIVHYSGQRPLLVAILPISLLLVHRGPPGPYSALKTTVGCYRLTIVTVSKYL